MAAGKSTVGRALARLLCREFIDLDSAIEEKTGVTISHIFDIEGESGFREREARMLAAVAKRGGAVVATGGGAVLREENRALLREGVVVYLRARRELLVERLENAGDTRPLVQGDAGVTVDRLLEERAPLYRGLADVSVDSRTTSALGTAHHICDLLAQLDKANAT